jgi:hypothetical protein
VSFVFCAFFLLLFRHGFKKIKFKPNFFFITNKLVITYKLSTIKCFYHKRRNFTVILVFVIVQKKLIKKEKKIGKKN